MASSLPSVDDLRVVLEVGELGDPLVQVGVADVRGIQVGELFVEGQGDVVGVVPGEFWH